MYNDKALVRPVDRKLSSPLVNILNRKEGRATLGLRKRKG
jgi:hypothetical protein